MTFEQVERAIEFITQTQAGTAATLAAIHEEVQDGYKKFKEKDLDLQVRLDKLLEAVTILIKVAESHERRLDRLDGILPA